MTETIKLQWIIQSINYSNLGLFRLVLWILDFVNSYVFFTDVK